MNMIFSFFLLLFSFSCSEQSSKPRRQEILLLQTERCLSDGGNVYIRCQDGRQKIVELGYGKFSLIEDGKISSKLEFCKEKPLELSINIKNAYVKYEEIKIKNGFRGEFGEPIGSVCYEVNKIENPGLFWKINMELTADAP